MSRKLGAGSSPGRRSWQQRGDQDQATAGTVTEPVTSVSSGAQSKVGGKETWESSSMHLGWGMQLRSRGARMFSGGRWLRVTALWLFAVCRLGGLPGFREPHDPWGQNQPSASLGLTQELASSSTVHSAARKPRCGTGAARQQARPRGLGKGDEDDSKVCS